MGEGEDGHHKHDRVFWIAIVKNNFFYFYFIVITIYTYIANIETIYNYISNLLIETIYTYSANSFYFVSSLSKSTTVFFKP